MGEFPATLPSGVTNASFLIHVWHYPHHPSLVGFPSTSHCLSHSETQNPRISGCPGTLVQAMWLSEWLVCGASSHLLCSEDLRIGSCDCCVVASANADTTELNNEHQRVFATLDLPRLHHISLTPSILSTSLHITGTASSPSAARRAPATASPLLTAARKGVRSTLHIPPRTLPCQPYPQQPHSCAYLSR